VSLLEVPEPIPDQQGGRTDFIKYRDVGDPSSTPRWNRWSTENRDAQALEERSLVLLLDPEAEGIRATRYIAVAVGLRIVVGSSYA